MANYTLTPSPWQTFFYANGDPVAAGQLFTYLAGTTTPAVTYLNSSGTPNTNPIILDAAGRAVIYLAGGSYRFDLYDSVANGGALIKTEDNITSVPVSASQPADTGVAGATILAGQVVYLSDGTAGVVGRWYLAQANNPYSSTTPQVGFALANTSAGNAISVIRIGQVVTGLTVTTGLSYYIDPLTAGSITATPPPLARYMGQADTASSLVVGNAPPTRIIFRKGTGSYTGAAASNVDSFIVPAMTLTDYLSIRVTVLQLGQPGVSLLLVSVSDINLIRLDDIGGGSLAAGTRGTFNVTMQAGPSFPLAFDILATGGLGFGGSSPSGNRLVAVSTSSSNWLTGGWTLGLAFGGQTAGGTLFWSWAVVKE